MLTAGKCYFTFARLPALFLWLTLLGTVPLHALSRRSHSVRIADVSLSPALRATQRGAAQAPFAASHWPCHTHPRSRLRDGPQCNQVSRGSSRQGCSLGRASLSCLRARVSILHHSLKRTPNSAWTAPPRGNEAASWRLLVGSAETLTESWVKLLSAYAVAVCGPVVARGGSAAARERVLSSLA